MDNGPSYQYIIVSDKESIIQFDWKLFYRAETILTCAGEEVPLPKEFIGKKLGDVRPDKYYFTKPK